MKEKTFAIIEIGSNNTKTHIYKNEELIYENTSTIELKKNYSKENKIDKQDYKELCNIIEKAQEYTDNISLYGCSIFRNMSKEELERINRDLESKYQMEIKVVTQEEEAYYTAFGCFANMDYQKTICILIGGGGSIELILVKNGKVIEKKYYTFGVVDITKKFPDLKEDIPSCSLKEVQKYIEEFMNDINMQAEILILAGGDHLYWYNNAEYPLLENTLYKSSNQKYMLTREMGDSYDQDAYKTSLNRIRKNSDNPLWFDGSRAMKAITNYISHKIDAKYIVPTKINMEDGIKIEIMKI